MVKVVSAGLALILTAPTAWACAVEATSYSQRGSHTYVTGATTCAAGRLDYRIYSGEQFITSGFTYFQGYAFQFYAPGALPEGFEMKYEIQPRS